jgi:hypothetical protein
MTNFSNQIDLGRMDGFVERMAALEHEMTKLTDIAVALARHDERILAMTTRRNLMDNRA